MLKPIILSLLITGFPLASVAQTGDKPYPVSVWARVLFGVDGKAAEYSLVDEDKYPASFAKNVKIRVARASIQPPELAGKPVTLYSGVELQFTVTPTPEGGTVRLDGVSMRPMPTKKFYASYPLDISLVGGWEGSATGTCKITIDGRCSTVEVTALPGMPESVRRHMRASLEKWEFEPQRVNGAPIEGEYSIVIDYNTINNVPDDFRQDKFLRILGNR